jgi:hypothetical protein
MSTGLSKDDSENSGLLTDIKGPYCNVVSQYITPYEHPLNNELNPQIPLFYALIAGNLDRDPQKW